MELDVLLKARQSVRRWIAALVLVVGAAPVRAAGPEPTTTGEPATDPVWPIVPARDYALSYTTAVESAPWRASLLQVGVLSAGAIWYYVLARDFNTIDWEYDYTWQTFEDKLVGRAYSFDNNSFDTNFISHPAAGALYYMGARGNRLSPAGALVFAFFSSTFWEFIGEFRERVSINDAFVTPLSGAAIGESMFQFGAFFDRGCATHTNRWLGGVFGPFKTLADALDGAKPERSLLCDANGFTTWGEHQFDLSLGGAITSTNEDPAAYGVWTTSASAKIVNLKRFGQSGSGWTSFSDGNMTEMSASVHGSQSGLDALHFAARTALVGLHYRDLHARPYASSLRGRESLIGLGVGSDYARERHGGLEAPLAPFFVLEAPALSVLWRRFTDLGKLQFTLLVASTLGASRSIALERAAEVYGREAMTTAATLHGYNHGLGLALAPALHWQSGRLELGVRARVDRLFGVRALDGDGTSTSTLQVTDARRRALTWLSIGESHGTRVTFEGSVADRSSSVGAVTARHREWTLGSKLGYRF